ncbi:hypothetical protein GCM10009541_36510 [Micromonospora gifhornensis]|uniref:Uncharacterized protein n=1 Tax=Micromonospora gifhornensis TaxID=84594 RepID=A0ABQ4IDE4_9ACTN|nr:hypothetical protein Vgi01_25920 [Micromonospora gifhornensis]
MFLVTAGHGGSETFACGPGRSCQATAPDLRLAEFDVALPAKIDKCAIMSKRIAYAYT